MGKIRRVRTKRHIEAVKNNANENDIMSTDFTPNESNLPVLFPVCNLFEIAEEKPKNVETGDNQESWKVIENTEEKLTTKKDKRKIRHEKFLKKLNASKIVQDNHKATKKREKTAITGDLNPLTQALLDIDKLPVFKTNKKKRKTMKKQHKSSSSAQKRLNAQNSDLEKFQQVLGHPSFKSNPLLTIDEHVRNVIKTETNS